MLLNASVAIESPGAPRESANKGHDTQRLLLRVFVTSRGGRLDETAQGRIEEKPGNGGCLALRSARRLDFDRFSDPRLYCRVSHSRLKTRRRGALQPEGS
jgi:hypothetical protein